MLAPSPAQLGNGGPTRFGGSSGLLGGIVPNVGGATAGNAAGVLSYCVRNRLLGGGGAASALNSLIGRRDITSSEGFAAAQSGRLETGSGGGLWPDGVQGKLKSKLCDMVLQHARSFL